MFVRGLELEDRRVALSSYMDSLPDLVSYLGLGCVMYWKRLLPVLEEICLKGDHHVTLPALKALEKMVATCWPRIQSSTLHQAWFLNLLAKTHQKQDSNHDVGDDVGDSGSGGDVKDACLNVGR